MCISEAFTQPATVLYLSLLTLPFLSAKISLSPFFIPITQLSLSLVWIPFHCGVMGLLVWLMHCDLLGLAVYLFPSTERERKKG